MKVVIIRAEGEPILVIKTVLRCIWALPIPVRTFVYHPNDLCWEIKPDNQASPVQLKDITGGEGDEQ